MKRSPLPLLLILLVAFGIYLHRIEVQSFWSDEGNTIAMAPRSIGDIIERSANDISPPLYYLVVAGWSDLVGTSEGAARALSALASTLTVALVAAIGLRVGGVGVALGAALATALSPYALHFAQEARMYAPVTTLATASWLLVARGRLGRVRSESAAYALLIFGMLWTQYFAIAVVIAQNLAWLWGVLRARLPAGWWRWVALQGVIGALYLPWYLRVREGIAGWPPVSPPIDPIELAGEILRVFSMGPATDGLAPRALGYALLLAVGVAISIRAALDPPEHARTPAIRPAALPLLMAGVPPLLMALLSLDRPLWDPKFLLIAAPGFYLLIAMGGIALLNRVPKRTPGLVPVAGAGLLAFLALGSAPGLYNELHVPRFWRDDYRGIVRTIEAQAEPGDAILLAGPGQAEIIEYYYDGPLAVYPLPEQRPLDLAATHARLEQIARDHERLYAIWWAEGQQDPELLIPRWLEEHAFEAGSRWFGNVRLSRYRLGEPPPLAPLDVTFTSPDGEGTLHLVGASLDPEAVVAGDVLVVAAAWAAEGVGRPLTFFAQLLDEANRVTGQYDGDGGVGAASGWGETPVGTRMGISVPDGAVPGAYRLVVGVYESDGGRRWLVGDGDIFPLATIEVELPVVPPEPAALALAPEQRRDVGVGETRLVGARANRLGFDHAPETPLRPGDPLEVLLYWQARRPSPEVPPLMLRLVAQDGAPVAEWPVEVTGGRFPPEQWRDRELVRDGHVWFLDAELPDGLYRVELDYGVDAERIGVIRVARDG